MRAQRVVGLPKTEKLDCAACGQVKELGVRCVCGWPTVEVLPCSDGKFQVTLPLGPSTNDRMMPVRMGRFTREILTPVARDYVATIKAELGPILERAREFGFAPIRTWTPMDVWMVLPRVTADCHNYEKSLYDALQAAGFVEDDRYILPRFGGIHHDRDTLVVVRA